jgi:hypothetical protein
MGVSPWQFRMSCIRTFLMELHSWQWLGILVARIAVGVLFFLPGMTHAREVIAPKTSNRPKTNSTIDTKKALNSGNGTWATTSVWRICSRRSPRKFAALGGVMIVGHCDHSDSKRQSDVTARLAFRIFLSSRGALSHNPCVVVFSGPGWLSVDDLRLAHARH